MAWAKGDRISAALTKDFDAARTISLLLVAGSFVAALAWPLTGATTVTSWQYVLSGCVGLLGTVATFYYRRLPSFAVSAIVVTFACAALFAGAITNYQLAGSSVRYEPFLANKLVALVIAVLAPVRVVVGYSIIIGCTALAIFESYFLFSPEFKSHVATPEPWSTLLYSIVAVAMFAHRLKTLKAIEERNLAEERTRVFLAIRDLANSPLQVIELSAALIRKKHPDASYLVTRMEQSMSKIRRLTIVWEGYEAKFKNQNRKIASK
jgi:hypothetical protein